MIPRISQTALLILALLVSTSCATHHLITATPCKGLDWFEIGRRDGAMGKPVDALGQHVRECVTGVPPDSDLYLNGRNAGLVDFCTTQSGYELGRAGLKYMSVCPEHLEKKFLPGYEQGRRAFVQDERKTLSR